MTGIGNQGDHQVLYDLLEWEYSVSFNAHLWESIQEPVFELIDTRLYIGGN